MASGVENLDNIDVQIVDLRQKDARSKESDIARIVHALSIHEADGLSGEDFCRPAGSGRRPWPGHPAQHHYDRIWHADRGLHHRHVCGRPVLGYRDHGGILYHRGSDGQLAEVAQSGGPASGVQGVPAGAVGFVPRTADPLHHPGRYLQRDIHAYGVCRDRGSSGHLHRDIHLSRQDLTYFLKCLDNQWVSRYHKLILLPIYYLGLDTIHPI